MPNAAHRLTDDLLALQLLPLLVLMWLAAPNPDAMPIISYFAGPPNEVALSPDGRWLALHPQNAHEIRVTDLDTGRRVATLTDAETSLRFSPDGQWLAAGDTILSTRDWKVAWQPRAMRPSRWSPDGRWLVLDADARRGGLPRVRIVETTTWRGDVVLGHADRAVSDLGWGTGPDGVARLLCAFGTSEELKESPTADRLYWVDPRDGAATPASLAVPDGWQVMRLHGGWLSLCQGAWDSDARRTALSHVATGRLVHWPGRGMLAGPSPEGPWWTDDGLALDTRDPAAVPRQLALDDITCASADGRRVVVLDRPAWLDVCYWEPLVLERRGGSWHPVRRVIGATTWPGRRQSPLGWGLLAWYVLSFGLLTTRIQHAENSHDAHRRCALLLLLGTVACQLPWYLALLDPFYSWPVIAGQTCSILVTGAALAAITHPGLRPSPVCLAVVLLTQLATAVWIAPIWGVWPA